VLGNFDGIAVVEFVPRNARWIEEYNHDRPHRGLHGQTAPLPLGVESQNIFEVLPIAARDLRHFNPTVHPNSFRSFGVRCQKL
jgi:hypothetical protein